MRKIPHGKILEREPKKQHINSVLKSCSYIYMGSSLQELYIFWTIDLY